MIVVKNLYEVKIVLPNIWGIWESVYNPNINYDEFAIIKSQAGLNSYKISVKEWVEKTNYLLPGIS